MGYCVIRRKDDVVPALQRSGRQPEGDHMIGIVTYLLGSVFLGTLICFWGKKLYFPFLMGTVFLCVTAAGIARGGENGKSLLLALAAGVLAAVLAKAAYRFGMFLVGAAGGAALGLLLAAVLPAGALPYRWLIAAAAALIAGVCAAHWCDVFVMLSTAYNGAALIAAPLCFLAMNWNSLPDFVYADGALSTMQHLARYLTNGFAEHNWWLLAATLAIAVLGFRYQRKKNAEA